MIGALVLFYFLPKLRAQSNAAGATGNAGGNVSAGNIVVASGISVRALALAPASGAAENSARPEIFLTGADHPNRVFELSEALRGGGAAVTAAAAAAAAATAGANLALVAGGGGAGSLGDGGAASAAQLNLKLDSLYERSGVAVAADGSIFIADTRNATIRRIAGSSASDAGVIRSVAGKWAPAQNVQLAEPMAIALDRAGNLYIADHAANAVIELHAATAAAVGRLEVIAHVPQPASIAVTADGGRIFVAAPEAGNVFAIDAQSRAISQLVGASPIGASPASAASTAASASHASGCSSASAGAANGSESICPAGLAADGGGNLFIADAAANRILRVDALTGKIIAAATAIAAPGEIVFDADGNLFVAEQGRNRISEIRSLGQPVSNLTLTPPPAPVPPDGVPCPALAPPPGFSSVTNFCAEPLSGATPTAPFIVTNGTNADITGLAITTIGLNPGDFVNSSSSCTATLRANSNCIINLAFAPMATGSRRATLVVTYTGATIPLSSAVAGTGDDYQIALASGQLTQISILAGQKGVFMLQVVPDNIFTGTVNFVCPGNMPLQTTCSFSPANSVNIPTPGTPVPVSVTFQTTSRLGTGAYVPPAPGRNISGREFGHQGPAMGSPEWIRMIRPGVWATLGGVALLGIFTSMLGRARERSPLLSFVAMLAIVSVIAFVIVGCSGGSTKVIIGTPAGSTTMIVQGATQGAARGITVTLDVE